MSRRARIAIAIGVPLALRLAAQLLAGYARAEGRANGVAPLRIHDVQGAAHISPYSGTLVTLNPAIVVAKKANGFYVQETDATADADPKTFEGLFVFTSSAPTVGVGDSVIVTGTVNEFRSGSISANLSITEIDNPGRVVVVVSTGNSLPTPATWTPPA